MNPNWDLFATTEAVSGSAVVVGKVSVSVGLPVAVSRVLIEVSTSAADVGITMTP